MRKILYLLLFITTGAYAQSGNVAGRVVTADNLPAQNVTISLLGAASSTSTNDAGKFAFNSIKPGQYTIKATIIGFKPSEQTITVMSGQITEVSFVFFEIVQYNFRGKFIFPIHL